MALVRAAKPGLFIDMSQTKQQEQGAAAEPEARKHWEWFWRIVAGLMLVVIAWVAWVLYQITPRSVVTPLAYTSQVRPISAAPPPAASAVPAAPAQEAAAPPVAQPGTAGAAGGASTDTAAAATQSGVRAVSVDAQAGSAEKTEEPVKAQGLRLATELSAPPADKPVNPKAGDGKPAGAAAVPAAGAARKDRP